jgi:phage FluMu protein Com
MAQHAPKFKSTEEEAEYWDRTDLSAYMDRGEWVPAGTGGLAEDRCPRCYSRRRLRRFNLNVADGRVTLRRVKGYHCPKCKTTSPARSLETGIRRIEKAAQTVFTK